MTPKEINDLKRRHNELFEQGRTHYNAMMALVDQFMAIRSQLMDIEGDNYDGVPLIFGSGYTLDED